MAIDGNASAQSSCADEMSAGTVRGHQVFDIARELVDKKLGHGLLLKGT